MDVYELCKLYSCSHCANKNIDSYEGKAYQTHMNKCDGPGERYFWDSRRNDGFYECDFGDDEIGDEILGRGTGPVAVEDSNGCCTVLYYKHNRYTKVG